MPLGLSFGRPFKPLSRAISSRSAAFSAFSRTFSSRACVSSAFTTVRHGLCFVMPASRARSGQRSRTGCWWGLFSAEAASKEIAERFSLHEIGADKSGEGKQTFDNSVRLMGKAQKHESDQGNGNLNAHGVFGRSQEAFDLQGLLDPAEEQLDIPSALVQSCDVLVRLILDRW